MVYTVLVVLGCLRNPLVILQKTSSFWWKSESLCFDYAQQPWQKILNHHMLWMCSHALHVLQVRIPTQQRHSDENQNLFVSTTLNNRDKRSWTKFRMTRFFAKPRHSSHATHVLVNQNLFVSTTLNNRDKRSWTKFRMTFFFAKPRHSSHAAHVLVNQNLFWEKTSPDSK